MSVKKLLVVMGVGYCCCAGMALAAQPYEDFSGSQLDPHKWYGRYWDSPESLDRNLDYVLEVEGGELHSMVRASTEKTGSYKSWTLFKDPNSINVIKASATVKSYSFASDDALAGKQVNNIGLGGYFYREEKGDVYGAVAIGDFNDGKGLIAGCQVLGGDGNVIWEVPFFDPDDPTDQTPFPVSIDKKYSLSVGYFPSLNEIFCEITDLSNAKSASIPLTVPPPAAGDASPGTPFKYLGSTYYIQNVADDTFWAVGGISASFDDVVVNEPPTLYDDFSSAPLDGTKWVAGERVRDIRDGQLHLNVQNFGTDRETNELSITSANRTDFLQADVTIHSETVLAGTDTKAGVRVQGNYYNTKYDGSGNYNGDDGEVGATTRLRYYSNGTVKAVASMWECINAKCDDSTDLFYKDVPCDEAKLDTPVTLTLEKKGDTMIFGCGQNSITYQMSGTVYESRYNNRKLRSRVYSASGQYGYLKATVDDVYTQKPGFSWPTFLPAILSGSQNSQ